MNLEGVKNSWDKLARTDPVGAMLPADVKGKLADLDDLFASGKSEIASLMQDVESLGISFGRKRGLDFGCGLGRMTQALADYFDEVYGVDIAPAIIEIANRNNRYPNKCQYFLNQTNDLKIFENNTFDCIWCYGVLHVVEPRFFRDYLSEFFRVLVPGGLVVFHQAAVPAKTLKGIIMRSTPTRLLNLYRRVKYGFEVYGMKRERVVELIEQAGGTIVHIREDRRTPGQNWIGFQYYAMKKLRKFDRGVAA